MLPGIMAASRIAQRNPPVALVTWNPADKSAAVVLSEGNLVAAPGANSGFSSVRATAAKSSGRWYFEFLVIGNSGGRDDGLTAGVAQLSASLNQFVGQGPTSWGHFTNGFKSNNGFSAYGVSWAAVGSVFMVALDLDAGKIWFGVNGSWMEGGAPATGQNPTWANVAGPVFPMISGRRSGGPVRARFAASDFAFAPPAGFSAFAS